MKKWKRADEKNEKFEKRKILATGKALFLIFLCRVGWENWEIEKLRSLSKMEKNGRWQRNEKNETIADEKNGKFASGCSQSISMDFFSAESGEKKRENLRTVKHEKVEAKWPMRKRIKLWKWPMINIENSTLVATRATFGFFSSGSGEKEYEKNERNEWPKRKLRSKMKSQEFASGEAFLLTVGAFLLTVSFFTVP